MNFHIVKRFIMYHLSFQMVFTFHSLSDMQDAAHIIMDGYHHKLLVDRLFSQGYKANLLRNSFQTFYGRYPDLIAKYQRPVRDMLNDSFPL